MRLRLRNALLLGAFASALGACSFDEGLIIENLRGKVRIPVAAATTLVARGEGDAVELVEIQDPRLIGPVYLGLYSDVEAANVLESYPHPSVGPVFIENVPGNTYPYGGTTIGDFKFGCLPDLACRMVSGRFTDYQNIIDWFEEIGEPLVDNFERPVTNSRLFQQQCYDLLDVTSDEEVRITVWEDRNGDGEFDELDLDFVLDDAGEYYVADFTIWQQEHFWDQDQENCTPGLDCRGPKLWGWMDSPSAEEIDPEEGGDPSAQQRFNFTTCNDVGGFDVEVYDAEYRAGEPRVDLLNFPAEYITEGDWVSSEPYQWDNVNEVPTLTLDFLVRNAAEAP